MKTQIGILLTIEISDDIELRGDDIAHQVVTGLAPYLAGVKAETLCCEVYGEAVAVDGIKQPSHRELSIATLEATLAGKTCRMASIGSCKHDAPILCSICAAHKTLARAKGKK